MSNRLIIGALLLFLPPAYGCYNNTGCPTGSVCVRTGNIMGTCISQGVVYTPTGPVLTNVPQGYSSVYSPGSTTGATIVPTPGVGVSSSGASQVPVVPYYIQPPVTAGTCTNTVTCPQGFVCSRPNGTYYGLCTQLAQ